MCTKTAPRSYRRQKTMGEPLDFGLFLLLFVCPSSPFFPLLFLSLLLLLLILSLVLTLFTK